MPTPPLAITGTPTASATAAGQLEVEAVAGAVAVHRREQDLARPRALGLGRPRHRVQPGRLAAAVGERPRSRAVGAGAGVDGDHHALRAELGGDLGDQLGPLDGRGVDGHLVGAGPQQPAGVLDRADAAADVNGMNTCSAVRRATSTMVSRASDEAVMSRNTTSSAPSAS